MSYKTDYKSVAGLGSAKDGTGHFVSQRLTAIALIPLVLLFVIPFIRALGTDHQTVLATYQHPLNAVIAIALFVAAFRHLRLGLQVVIEDYVHGDRTRMIFLITNALIWRGFLIAGVFAVAKIALTA